ncbi:ABC transporter [Lachnellula hyalina]|uniref:ABC transporter n=1 Tax=Lachnellula hyalina TaxID=1316788 RepID=A0A8H8U3K1_9HELO|nr:ABC transporter [Lachnellula hyalina]TVY29246.1 ABC transporter [Lachnellula hyalina]
MASTCQPLNDNVFGPVVQGCRSGFDFTLLFEQTILSIGPAALLLLSTPPRLLRLLQTTRKTISSRLRSFKALNALLLVGVQLGLLIAWAPQPPTRATVPSSVLSILAALAILFLSLLEHSRAVQPSFLVNVYLLVSLSFDAVQTRTLYLRHEKGTILGLFTANIAIKATLLLLESKNKRKCLNPPYNSYPPEAISGVFNRSFFWWLNPTLADGFRKLLTVDDLFKTDNNLLSRPLQERARNYWDKYRTSTRLALLYTIFQCIRLPLAHMVFPRLCLIGFNYAQPFLINSAIAFVSLPIEEQNKSVGYGLIGAAGLIYLGIALSTANYTHQMYRAITIFRGSTVSLIYAKTLELQAEVYDESTALTLMSTDIDRLSLSLQAACEIWARAIELSIGLWLLERQMGWICVAPLFIVAGSIFFSSKVATRMGPRQREWLKGIQRRVGMTSSMLGSMKSVKMMGISDNLSESLQKHRIFELELSKKFRVMGLWRLLLSFVPTILAPLSCFIIFAIKATVDGSDRPTAGETFSSLAIISLLTSPASDFLQSLPQIGMATGCLDRIQVFLLSVPRRDDRISSDLSNTESNTEEVISEEQGNAFELKPLPSRVSISPAMIVQDLYVRPSEKSPVALHGLSFRVNKGSLAMIVGIVGSGKSTLLKSIIGELRCESGSISVSSKRVAYCSQSSWLPNATVRQIVCGVPEASCEDALWYKTVLHACAFDEDVAKLPSLDDTLIGSRGVTLSGGQKQRLALARAVYARRDVNILDDVLSAIDAKTERLVVDRLLGNTGLFKKLGSTVVLATHAVRHLPLSDQIIVLGADGNIAEQGTFKQLRSQDGFVNKIILSPELLQSKENQKISANPSSNQPSGAAPKSLRGPTASDTADLSRRIGDISVYKYYLHAIGWKNVTVSIVTSVIYMFCTIFPPLWLTWYANGTVSSLPLFISIYAVSAVIALCAIALVLFNLYMRITPESGARLHEVLLRSVMGAPQSFFDETDSGITLNRFSQDMTIIDGQLPISAVLSFSSALRCLGAMALIAVGSTYMAITCPALILAIYFLQKYYLRTSRQLRFLDLECKSPLYTHFAETLEGLSTIRAFGWQESFISENLERLDNSQRPYYMLYCIQRWLNLVLQLLITVMVVIVMALATSLTNTTSGGQLGISLSSVISFNSTLAILLLFWTQLETSLGAIARLKGFEEGTLSENKPQETFVPNEEWPGSGAIEFKNVSASYGQGAPALQDISFRINAGEKIGICGRTGSGKSSLLSVLLRIIDIDSGSLTIDGLDLELIRRETIRSRLITIPQDPFILSGSVRLNADPSGNAGDESIIAALAKVGLWDILESRGGLEANMNTNPLSQGQLQIFCLARAMLRTGKGKILVLDEATSSVDSETDLLMQRLIREEFSECIVLTVAHRLDTIMDSDRVIVLDAGRLVEMGSPEELMKREGAFWGLRGGSHND